MTRTLHRQRRAGFTLLELAVALVLFALVVGNVFTILGSTTNALGDRNVSFDADVQARRTLDRIAMAVLGSNAESIYATAESPGFEPSMNYVEFLGMADLEGDGGSEPVYSPQMRIGLTGAASDEVSWSENPGEENEKRVVWLKGIAQFAQGEIAANGIDDNGNGLIDETGLAFVKDGRSVRILLSMRRPDGKGGFIDRELETTVTCRN